MGAKNIYGIKKDTGETVSIYDLSDAERGAKCGCKCNWCQADFIARMGEVRTAHFAHSGEGCDIEKANMTGLFMLIRDYLLSDGEISFPAAEWKCNDPIYSPYHFIEPITERNFDKRVTLEIDIFNPKKCTFDSAEIIQSQNGYPVAMLCKKGSYTLALRVVPPSTICKTSTRTAYEDYPTLLLDLSKKSFEDLSRKEIGTVLNTVSLFSWKQYVPLKPEKRKEIIARSAALCEQEKQKQRESTTKDPTITYLRTALSKPATPSVPASLPHRKSNEQYGETIRLTTDEMTYQRIANEPKVVLDSRTGERVGVCYVCKRPKVKAAFAILPTQQKNIGICKMCAEKWLK